MTAIKLQLKLTSRTYFTATTAKEQIFIQWWHVEIIKRNNTNSNNNYNNKNLKIKKLKWKQKIFFSWTFKNSQEYNKNQKFNTTLVTDDDDGDDGVVNDDEERDVDDDEMMACIKLTSCREYDAVNEYHMYTILHVLLYKINNCL